MISSKVGPLKYKEGGTEEIMNTYLTDASVLYDAFYTPNGDSVDKLKDNDDYKDFINDGFKYCKIIAFDKEAAVLLDDLDIVKDDGVFIGENKDWTSDYITAMKGHRFWERELAMQK